MGSVIITIILPFEVFLNSAFLKFSFPAASAICLTVMFVIVYLDSNIAYYIHTNVLNFFSDIGL